MTGYNVTFESLFEGTLCGKWPLLSVWTTLLAMRDHRGYIDKTPQYIHRVTGIPLEILSECIARFMEPDPESRTPEDEGRRLRLIDPKRQWGWVVINHKAYNEKARLVAKNRREVENGENAGRMKDRRPPPKTAGDRREPPVTPSLNSQLSTLNSQLQEGRGDARGEADPSPTATAKQRTVKSKNGSEEKPKRSKRFPKDFPIEPWRTWTANNCPGVGFDVEIATLRDHEFRDAHSDWEAVIRNWMRRAHKAVRKPNGSLPPRPGAPTTHAELVAALDSLPPVPGDD